MIAVWVYFFAWTQGVPAKMAFSITRLAPDVEPHGTSVFLFLLAVIATLLWIAIVFWRLFKHPVFSWRGAWMAGTGLTAVWIIVMSLFVNLIDGARSMKPIVDNFKAVAVENKIPLDKIGASHLTLSNIAAFNTGAASTLISRQMHLGSCVPLTEITMKTPLIFAMKSSMFSKDVREAAKSSS